MQTVNWGDKDFVAEGFLKIWRSLSTSELIQISGAAYDKKVSILIQNFGKTKDCTVNSALKVVALLSWGDKDIFLLQAVDQVTDLTAGNLPSLAKGAYEKEAEILKKGLARLSK